MHRNQFESFKRLNEQFQSLEVYLPVKAAWGGGTLTAGDFLHAGHSSRPSRTFHFTCRSPCYTGSLLSFTSQLKSPPPGTFQYLSPKDESKERAKRGAGHSCLATDSLLREEVLGIGKTKCTSSILHAAWQVLKNCTEQGGGMEGTEPWLTTVKGKRLCARLGQQPVPGSGCCWEGHRLSRLSALGSLGD